MDYVTILESIQSTLTATINGVMAMCPPEVRYAAWEWLEAYAKTMKNKPTAASGQKMT